MEIRPWHDHYDDGVPRSLTFDQTPLSQWIGRTADEFPDNPAIHYLNARLTFGQLRDEVDRLATALAGLGVTKGSRVAIQMPNLPQLVIGYYAAMRLGAVVVMTNPVYMPYEIEHQWNDAGVEVALVMDFVFEQKIADMRDRLPVKHYVLASIPEYLRFPMRQLAPFKLKRRNPPAIAHVAPTENIHRFRDLIRQTEPDVPDVAVSVNDLAVLQDTGGTTGPSKGAMLTHGNLSYNTQQITAWFVDVERGAEVVLGALPLFHVFGMTNVMNWSVHVGAAMVLLTDPRDIDSLVRNIVRHKVTLLPAVPAMFNAVNSYPGVDRMDLTSLKCCFSGSAPMPRDVLERFEQLTGGRILEGFGMSETSPVTHANPVGGLRKIGSIGIPMPDTEVKIVDAEDGTTELPVGSEGELLIRGPQVMQGYWQQPEETENALRDGWLYTGDLATLDEDGYFRIVGRTKDMINCSGFKVYPDEVDEVLMAHPAVLETATIGIPHPAYGETVKSFIVTRPGQRPSADDIREHCAEHLARYKVPREIEFLDELPKSAVLKILRRELRARETLRRESQEAG